MIDAHSVNRTCPVTPCQLLMVLAVSCAASGTGMVAADDTQGLTTAEVVTMLESGESQVRIVCFGDSITGVYYHSGSQRAWCDMLGIALQQAYPRAQIEMVNAGVSGNTTVPGLRRMDRDVLARQPHLVVVSFGMNDVSGLSLDQFQQNLETIVRRCHGAGAAVILCTPNSVYENTARPNAKLKELADRIHAVASPRQIPVVDLYQAWIDQRREDERAWMLLMSDTIHPNMNGHRRFAELIASQIVGRAVRLGPTAPPADGLRQTRKRLEAGEPVRVIAMPPYDSLLPTVLRAHFPQSQIDVTTWPVQGQTLPKLREWGRRIRQDPPHLVVVAVPASVGDESDAAYIDNYEWILNWSFHFSERAWDVVPVMPQVTGMVAPQDEPRQELAHQLIIGKDIEFIDRGPDDDRSAVEIVQEWVTERLKRPDASTAGVSDE